MSTPINCPNCGSQLPPDAAACARCGERFSYEESAAPPIVPPPPKSAPPARVVPTASRKRTVRREGQLSIDAYFGAMRDRWGLEATPFFTGVLALLALSVLAATVVLFSYLTSDATAFSRHFHDQVWLDTAAALALAGLVIAVLVRWEAPGMPEPPSMSSIDMRVGIVLVGIAKIALLIGLFVSLDSRASATDAWSGYGVVWAFVAATWFALSQPIPERFFGVDSKLIGLVSLGVGVLFLVIGQFRAQSEDAGSYINGLAFQAFGISLLVVALGWFLGKQQKGA